MTRSVRSISGAVLAAALFTTGTALAQFPPAPPAPAPEAAPVPPPPAPEPAPVPAPAPAAAPAGTSDLDQLVGHWGIGYMGSSMVPLAADPLSLVTTDMAIPAIGIRYWLNPKMGIDAGLGLGFTGGSTESGGLKTDKNGTFGFLLHGGVPMALLNSGHVSFQVIPYLEIARGQTSVSAGTTKVDQSGVRVSLGGRVGFEVFFGFIGIPQLALNATVGAEFSYVSYTASAGGASATNSSYGFSTTVQDNPWDIFAGNVAARYYF